jgi:uncharacterized RDD family membrane protein YckC
MFCSKCGTNVAEGAGFCGSCGQPVGGAVAGPGAVAIPAGYVAVRPTVAFAGFWLRVVAAIIDGFVIGIPMIPVYLVIFASLFSQLQSGDLQNGNAFALISTMLPKFMLLCVIYLIGAWLYWGFMESSSWQATLGKKALGLTVTDLEGRRATFAKTSGRFFAGRGAGMFPYIGALYFLVSCICAGFTEKKQALHDMIAGCLVIRKV